MARKLRVPRKISRRQFVLWLAVPLACSAYTSIEVGIDSNLLIDGDRVLFAQSDGSLTALDIILERFSIATAWVTTREH